MLINLVAATVALIAAHHHHARRGGRRPAAALMVLLALGSGLWLAVVTLGPGEIDLEIQRPFFALALASAALGVTYGLAASDRSASQVHGRLDRRWLTPLVLLFLAIVSSPVSALLVLPVVASVPELERRGRAWKGLVGLAVALLLLGGWLGVRSGALAPYAGDLASALDPRRFGWSLADLVAGRNFGLLVWFPSALLLLACYRWGSGRGWLVGSVAVATLLLALLQPHGPRAAEGTPVNLAFLPLYGALWFVPARVPRMRWLALGALAAGLFLWPAWRAPFATARGQERPSLHRYSLAHHLPYETTREHAPVSAEWRGTGVLSRALGAGLADGERGPVLVPSAGPAGLMIAAERRLEALLLDFGPEAATELGVEGGRAGNTVFRPDGGVRFEIVLGAPDRVHPMWFSPKPHNVYLLEIEMPGAPNVELPVAILARPEDALPRSLDPSSAGREP